MGLIAKLFGRRESAPPINPDAFVLSAVTEAISRELRLLPRVCGEDTKSGKPCLVRPAEGYDTCSRHGGKNAAPRASQAG